MPCAVENGPAATTDVAERVLPRPAVRLLGSEKCCQEIYNTIQFRWFFFLFVYARHILVENNDFKVIIAPIDCIFSDKVQRNYYTVAREIVRIHVHFRGMKKYLRELGRAVE